MMNWGYEAKQNIDGIGPIKAEIVPESGTTIELLNYGYHSPDGFQIGYEGSGPADLAYSILFDYFVRKNLKEEGMITDDYFVIKKVVEPLHQQFKRDFIAKEKEHFQIYSDVIGLWIKERE